MTREAASTRAEALTWEDTTPHFSVREKRARITALPLEAPGMLGFMTVLTFVLWVPATASGAIFFSAASQGSVTWWHGALAVLYSFLPAILTGITSDEARDRFGQRTTGTRVAVIPAFAGCGVGLAGAALWVGGFGGLVLGLAGLACAVGAGLAAVAGWWGIRYVRRRQAWIMSLRQHGTRSSGVLRDVTFLKCWSSGQPQFSVIVEYATESGRHRVTANMSTATKRVPRPGAAAIVTRAPHDEGGEPLIELDYATQPKFDRDSAKYSQPSGN